MVTAMASPYETCNAIVIGGVFPKTREAIPPWRRHNCNLTTLIEYNLIRVTCDNYMTYHSPSHIFLSVVNILSLKEN